MHIRESSAFSIIKLSEDGKVPNKVQVLRVGKFKHEDYGDFEITAKTLSEMKKNFDSRIRGIDMSFDYYHESEKDASGWVGGLELSEDGTELWAVDVAWTPKAKQKLAEKELRYFSPDFSFQWQDPEKLVMYDNVLFGGGLTNRPFVKEMKAIVANENKGKKMTELEKAQKEVADLKAANLKLSEQVEAGEKQMMDMQPKSKVQELEAAIAKMQGELAAEKQKSEMAMADKMKMEQEKVLAEKEGAFNLLLSEGKACVAQKAAFLASDMTAFIKLAEPLNMKAKGSSESGGDVSETDANAIIKLAEEKQKADPKLTRGDALSLAKKEMKK